MARQARINPAMRWFDDRLHISGVVDAALSHPVPKRVHPLDYLGEATLFIFLNQAITGMMLAMFYNGSAHSAYSYDATTGEGRPDHRLRQYREDHARHAARVVDPRHALLGQLLHGGIGVRPYAARFLWW